MPIFAYHCAACGHIFDALQKLGAAALTECPECGANQLKKQLSAPAFHLKGKGWRKSDDRPKKPDVRPRFAHTLDSAVPHAEHHERDLSKRQAHDSRQPKPAADPGHTSVHGHDHGHHGHSHEASHSHNHGHSHETRSAADARPKGGLGKLVKAHVESSAKVHGHGHEHSSGHSHGPGGHSHSPGGHSHASKAGLKPAKKHKHD